MENIKNVIVITVVTLGMLTLGTVAFLFFIHPGGDSNLREIPNINFIAYVYDGDNTTAENYSNENVIIELLMTAGYYRNVGDIENGLTIVIKAGSIGAAMAFSSFTVDVRGQTNYTTSQVEKSGSLAISDNKGIRWRFSVPITESGRFEEGMRAYIYLWTDNNVSADADNLKVDPTELLIWNENDYLGFNLSCNGYSEIVEPVSLKAVAL